MATESKAADDIRREMAQIRRDLHVDMQGVVAGAEAATDWRHYVRLYPWAALGLAFGAGFLLVPRRRRSVSQTAEQAADAAVAKVKGKTFRVEMPSVASSKTVEKEKTRSGLWGALFGMVVPVVMKAAQNYASHYVETLLAQNGQFGPEPAGPSGPPPASPPPPAGPDPRRPVIPPRPF